ncbi:NAD(+) diphosphatase [Micromonospora sp. NBRC 101691]|uniref:NAD(+) diphosphatase n=1 Tax=Micromonospora sp. NBRC 101691 TaxID=3032198 RepID=UPI0024A56DE8|nr:NAD(+) diphosphatase [Micromonospora sp. NBRC 101691]GLY25353.1 NADH pyrophosphatase [Micromonospora sp. NBRC 101691]
MRSDGYGLTYGGGWLDRAGARRDDPAWLAALLTLPDTGVLALWRDRCLVTGAGTRPVRVPATDAAALLAEAGEVVFLGLDDRAARTGPVGGPAVDVVPGVGAAGGGRADGRGGALFAVDLSELTEARALAVTGADAAVDVRAIVGALSGAEAALQAYARGLLHWHRQQRFCGGCGAVTVPVTGGHARRCAGPDCGRLLFPRIEPAVIVLVEASGPPARCLLARHAGAGPEGWSTLAGFVEVGESLEDAVRRELAEEAGVSVRQVSYQGSQAWPFPAGLMVGFRAVAVSDRVRVDGVELVEARWFSRAELRARLAAGLPMGRPDSIGHRLLHDWLTADD